MAFKLLLSSLLAGKKVFEERGLKGSEELT